VICSDGFTYERSAIEKWLSTHRTSPMTGAELRDKNLVSNINLRSQIIEYTEKKGIPVSNATPMPVWPDRS